MSQAELEAAARPASLLKRATAVGPGIVYMLTIVGAGDVVSNTAAGADYGYVFIWALGLTVISRYVWVGTSAKYVLATGETILQGYGRLGGWIIWILLISTVVSRHLYNLYLISMMGSSADFLVHLPTRWSSAVWSFLLVFVGFALAYWGGYQGIEKYFKVILAAKGTALVLGAVLSRPDPVAIVKGTLIPSFPGQEGFYSAMLIIMALIGTEAGAMTNLTYPYFIYEKGWRNISFLPRQKFDLAFGAVGIFVMGALLQIAGAGVAHAKGINLQGPEHIAQIFSETLGPIGGIVFALGLCTSAFATFVGASAGYAIFTTDMCRSFVPRLKKPLAAQGKKEAIHRDPIYRWFLAYAAFSPLYIVFTGVRPVALVLMVSAMMVFLIPIMAVSLLILTNDRKLMGAYKNGWITNAILGLLIAASLYLTGKSGMAFWNNLMKAVA